ncbi:MAG: acetyl-CoA carboxylase biotin carboxylase subunit, partial [Planctomycetes bacterium]|nr:acetyl-CoA carboxylase biotin carboxylase subunit [Planctomycetota bacterium]
ATVCIEKFVEDPRHVEIQILGDRRGNIVHLGERDCSVRRRHQKLVEESPSPSVTPQLREEMGRAAVAIARESKYHNAGTVEFLLDHDNNFFFIEVNARIQVEHTVTEMVTGVDLIQAQLKIASGEPLELRQEDVRLVGHAIECRINAEDPDRDFQPSPGRIDLFMPPGGPGIRWDSHVHGGYVVPPHYDSMVGKLLSHRRDRESARRTMQRALHEFVIEGIKTTVPLHQRIMAHSDFRSGTHDTGFVERYFSARPKVIGGVTS